MVSNEDRLGVVEVAKLSGVSEETIHRWKRDADNPGMLPPPERKPGPAKWTRSTINSWLRTYAEVRDAEDAMSAFADDETLDPVLRRVARHAKRLFEDSSIPIVLRRKLSRLLGTIRWDAAKTGTLSAADELKARKVIVNLMFFRDAPDGDKR